jgi:hypothetical protein
LKNEKKRLNAGLAQRHHEMADIKLTWAHFERKSVRKRWSENDQMLTICRLFGAEHERDICLQRIVVGKS